ncbi:hypothetical protein jpw_24190 [Pseudomonas asiatica]|uniref:hypothetical protein n=1 Tax=Pseudomonas asiatica TaxID=2219225 RepID=UPI0021F76F3A|nr:hypothetical protein [Pseudomonas asiatica]UYP85199.1 hypothetical protein jpw_24190 [Pseudomonas asiatica]
MWIIPGTTPVARRGQAVAVTDHGGFVGLEDGIQYARFLGSPAAGGAAAPGESRCTALCATVQVLAWRHFLELGELQYRRRQAKVT